MRTAEILFIHRNTVRYRINKCMELLGSDLEDGNEIFAFILSLRMLEYRRKLLDPADQSSRFRLCSRRKAVSRLEKAALRPRMGENSSFRQRRSNELNSPSPQPCGEGLLSVLRHGTDLVSEGQPASLAVTMSIR